MTEMLNKPGQHGRLTIGLVTHDIFEADSWWAGARESAREHGVNLITFPAGFAWQDSPECVLQDLLGLERLDGVLLAQWWPDREAFEQAYQRYYAPLPVVNIQRFYEGIPGVMVGNYEGMLAEMRHLIEDHGYRRIAFICGPEGNPSADERYRAYVDALSAHTLPLNENLVLPGNFDKVSGETAMQLLLDERGLQPCVDFDAVVAANDLMAIGVMTALQKRGIRIPYEVAVAGFDDVVEGRFTMPPLTTVKMPNYELGQLAVETLLARIADESVVAHVMVPAHFVMRKSCGCVSPAVMQAGENEEFDTHAHLENISFSAALATQRSQMIVDIQHVLGEEAVSRIPLWLSPLLESLEGMFNDTVSSNMFLSVLYNVLRDLELAHISVALWQNVLSTLRRHVLQCAGKNLELRCRVESLWQQARVLVEEVSLQTQLYHRGLVVQQTEQLYTFGQSLLMAFNLRAQMDLLAQTLPTLGIPGCYLSLYDHLAEDVNQARLLLAYHEQQRLELSRARPGAPEGRAFSARQIVPGDVLPQDRPYSLVVEPLYSPELQLGFVAFEVGPEDGKVYDVLSKQISSALQGALLSQERESLLSGLERRALLLQTAAEVSRVANSILAPDELIQEVVNLVRERFQLYYVGLFLVDQERRWAVLRAGTGEAGARMMAQGHRLEVGGASMIGQCVATQQARIALDVGAEAVRFDNPFLPDTHSELALPLVSRGESLGALTIQSKLERAFSDEDITVLQSMANQLANAIENARLFEQSQAALKNMAAIQRQYEGRAWAEYMQSAPVTHYEITNQGDTLNEAVLPEVQQVLAQKEPLVMQQDTNGRAALVMPITQRGGTAIGALGIHDAAGREWSEDEKIIVSAVVERMSLFAETLRLLEASQHNAARERVTREITGRMRETLDLETVLQTAAQEIRSALQTPEVVIRLTDRTGERSVDEARNEI
ncbi:MAG: substrate-binding domain-containing protein [Anaerolineae bacterium]|nr:substrate-binding domain-containing protein [Anaerolineae bacterium]